MNDDLHTEAERLAELKATGEAVGKLAEDPEIFRRVVAAYRAQDAERFQAELLAIGLFDRCHLICRWLCSKHSVFLCRKLCGPLEGQKELDINEMREFALVVASLTQKDELLKRLIAAVEQEDAEAFQKMVLELGLQRFCHQLCQWLCAVRCRRVCRLLCTAPPLLTQIGSIPTSQINGLGYAAGASSFPGPVPPDNKPAGVGDHPFGGTTNIRGVFSIASPAQYRVEFATAIAGPWQPIVEPIQDYRISATFPTPVFDFYTRVPTPDGWYTISEMGLAGADYLTDWQTPNVANGLYYLRLTVRTAALSEFVSPVVPVRIDNQAPSQPEINLQLLKPDGSRSDLGCCEKVDRGNGNRIIVQLKATDANFSSISVSLLGGCGVSRAMVATDGTALSKTYNGDITDTGYPVATEFIWDPWAADISPCCYLIYVQITDRAIVNNYWSGGHSNTNWHSITIA